MPRIHPTALISPTAELADDVEIGPFAVIDGPVKLAGGVKIGGHAWISGRTEIGERTQVGWGCIVGADPQDLSFDPATESGVVLGPDNRLREYVTIHRASKDGAFTRVGSGNFLMTGVHLAHDVAMGDSNVLANNVALGGHVIVGNRVFLGGGSFFHQFIRIGDMALSQGLAAVSQDVPPYCMIQGQNFLCGLNVVGLRRAGIPPEARTRIKRLYRLIFLSGMPRGAALAEATAMPLDEREALFIDAIAHPSRKGVAAP